jgi:hypothetical protein
MGPENYLCLTSGDLSGDLPTGASQSWQATSFCIGSSNVYIIFQDTNLSPNETHQIQAWDIATWNVTSGWPSTGTTLPGTGTVDVTKFESAVEIVSGSKVATANSWYGTITSSSDPAITVVNSADGTISGSGAGDHPGSQPSANRIASDGTYVYFTLLPTSGTFLCSLDISSPTTAAGSGSSDLPYGVSGGFSDVCCTGSQIIASGHTQDVLTVHHTSYERIGEAAAADPDDWQYGGSMVFDGNGVWCLGALDRNSTTRPCVFKVDTGAAIAESASIPGPLPDLKDMLRITMGYDPDIAYAQSNLFAPITYDGDNIWLVILDGSAYKLRRINKAAWR